MLYSFSDLTCSPDLNTDKFIFDRVHMKKMSSRHGCKIFPLLYSEEKSSSRMLTELSIKYNVSLALASENLDYGLKQQTPSPRKVSWDNEAQP